MKDRHDLRTLDLEEYLDAKAKEDDEAAKPSKFHEERGSQPPKE